MLSCREVTRTVAADTLDSASLGRRLAVRLHLLMCRHCRRYAGQMRAIGDGARQLFREEGEDRDRLGRLRASILGRGDSDDREGRERDES